MACYHHILGRPPENEEIVGRLVGWDFWGLVQRFAHSDEHRMKIGRTSSHSLLKSLEPDYLARGLSIETRASAVICNYAVLRERLSPASLVMLLQHGLKVIDGVPQCPDATVEASLFDGPVNEGEISLIASFAGRRLAVLTFTVVPGEDFGLSDRYALLVSRIQGYRGTGDDFRNFTRGLAVAPPLALIAALEGVASALDIHAMLGVGAETHPCAEVDPATLRRGYDDLFASLGAERLPSGLFHLSLPHRARPLDEVPAKHRARSRKRRLMRDALAKQAEDCWRSHLRAPVVRSIIVPAPQPAPMRRQSVARRWAGNLTWLFGAPRRRDESPRRRATDRHHIPLDRR